MRHFNLLIGISKKKKKKKEKRFEQKRDDISWCSFYVR